MRFAAVQKWTCYLMVFCTVAPVAFAGEIPAAALALFVTAVVGSWFVEPTPQASKATILWNLVVVAYTIALFADAARGSAIVTNLVYWVLGLLVHRLYNRRASKDYLYVYVLSFLMLVIATTVATGISFLVFFVFYIVLIGWSLVFHHLRREMEENYLLRHADAQQSERVEVGRVLNSRRIVGGPFLAGTALVSLGVFISSLTVFFLFPRVGFGFMFGQGRTGTTMAGFAESVKLGGHGAIKDNPEVVMRVMFEQPPAVPLHWRGAAFATYRNGQWTHVDDRRRAMTEFASPDGRTAIFLPAPPPHAADVSAQMRMDRALTYEIFLEPIDSPVLFAADRPVAFEMAGGQLGSSGVRLVTNGEQEVRSDRIRTTTLQYRAYSDTEPLRESVLVQAGEDIPPGIATRYLALPVDMPQPVTDLARTITEGKQGPYAKAKAIREYLLANYRYTLELQHDERLDPVYEFLFIRKQGHCEYFASAMALLARAAGVPSRVVNGFLGGAWNDVGKFLAVRQGDAHSWTEVYFGGIGWMPFEATPPAGQLPQARTSPLREIMDAARLAWTRWFLEYDLAKQVEVVKNVARWMGGKPLPSGIAGAREAAKRLARPLLIIAGLLAAIAMLVQARPLFRGRRGGSVRSLVRHPATRLYRRLLARLERQGARKRDSETPDEFVRALRVRAHPALDLATRVTHVYHDARFGGVEPDVGVLERLTAEVRQLAKELPPNGPPSPLAPSARGGKATQGTNLPPPPS